MARPVKILPEETRRQIWELHNKKRSRMGISKALDLTYYQVWRELSLGGDQTQKIAPNSQLARSGVSSNVMTIPNHEEGTRTMTQYSYEKEKARAFREELLALEQAIAPKVDKHPQSSEGIWQERLKEQKAYHELQKLESPDFQKNEQLRIQIEQVQLQTQLSDESDKFRNSSQGRAIFGEPRQLYYYDQLYCAQLVYQHAAEAFLKGMNPQQVVDHVWRILPVLCLRAYRPAN